MVAEPLNEKPKYVVTTGTEPLAWQNSTLVAGDNLGAAVAALKQADGGDLHTIGSWPLGLRPDGWTMGAV